MQTKEQTQTTPADEVSALRHRLARLQARFRRLSEASFEAIIIHRQARILEVNQAAADVLGYERSAMVGMDGLNLVAPASREIVRENIAGGYEKPYEATMLRADGSTFPADLRGKVVSSGADTVRVTAVRDITERKQARQALEESRRRFRTVADFTYDWEYWIGPEGEFLYVSPACQRITGYDRQAFLENPQLLQQITHRDDRAALEEHLQHEVKRDEPLFLEFRISTRAGEERWIEHACQPVKDDEGRRLGRRASNRDATDRKAMEQELRVKESAIASSINGIAITDLQGSICYVNQAFVDMWGYNDVSEVLGRLPPDFVERPREVGQVIEELLDASSWVGELRAKRKDGSTFIVQLSASLVADAGGRPIRMMSSFVDVTEARHAQRQIARQAEEILELSTPVIELWEGIVVVPLIGTLDSRRAQRLAEDLLDAIASTQSDLVLVDVTGVPTIDTQTARHLIETITAVRLLGADMILTGVRPAIAQTIVHLGLDLSNITTRSSLAAGLRVALGILGEGM